MCQETARCERRGQAESLNIASRMAQDAEKFVHKQVDLSRTKPCGVLVLKDVGHVRAGNRLHARKVHLRRTSGIWFTLALLN